MQFKIVFFILFILFLPKQILGLRSFAKKVKYVQVKILGLLFKSRKLTYLIFVRRQIRTAAL